MRLDSLAGVGLQTSVAVFVGAVAVLALSSRLRVPLTCVATVLLIASILFMVALNVRPPRPEGDSRNLADAVGAKERAISWGMILLLAAIQVGITVAGVLSLAGV